MTYQQPRKFRTRPFGKLFALVGFFASSLWRGDRPGQEASPKQEHAMGSAPCVWAEPIRGAGKALDVAAIRILRDDRFNCVAHVIESPPPNLFDDFKELLAAGQTGGISMLAVLIPPDEAIVNFKTFLS
jgi:hypothetical protein